jgi:hypothetical protein
MAAAPTAALLSAIRDGEQRGRSSAAAPSPSRAATAPSCRRQPSHAASGPCRATPGASYIASASLPCYGFSSGRWSLLPWMLHQAEKKLCHSKMEAQAEAAIAVGHYLSSRASASASGRQGHERRGASSLRPDAKHTTTRSWRACSPPRASCVTWPTAVSRGTTEPAHLNAPASLRAGRLESW